MQTRELRRERLASKSASLIHVQKSSACEAELNIVKVQPSKDQAAAELESCKV